MTLMDDFDLDDIETEEEDQPSVGRNRTFRVVAGILGGILILSLVSVAVYAMWFLPQDQETVSSEIAESNVQNTEIAMLSAQTAEAEILTSTPTTDLEPTDLPDEPMAAAAASNTPDEVESGTSVDPRTATVAALLTQKAPSVTPGATELPDTGIMEDVGIPGLVALAGTLVLVIILARRFRLGS